MIDGVTAPTIAVAIEIAMTVVAIPVVSDAEDHGRNSEGTVVFWPDVDAPALIECLDIATGDPATTTIEFHIAPRHIRQATMDLYRFAGGITVTAGYCVLGPARMLTLAVANPSAASAIAGAKKTAAAAATFISMDFTYQLL